MNIRAAFDRSQLRAPQEVPSAQEPSCFPSDEQQQFGDSVFQSGWPQVDASSPLFRIATISKSDLFGGGASRVAQMLADQLAIMGHSSVQFCNRPGNGYSGIRQAFSPGQNTNEAIRLGHAVARKLGLAESLPLDTVSLLRRVRAQSAEIVHVHDTTTAISPVTIDRLARDLPVVWTLHDASPFTGGCIFPGLCRRFQASCGQCPQLGKWPLDGLVDFTPFHLRLRQQLHASGRITVLSPSQWMSDLAFSSGMLTRPPVIMPNPVDTTVFAPPLDKRALRRKLGLPEDRLVIVGVAGDIADTRKGMADFLSLATSIADLDPHVILIGKEDGTIAERLRGTPNTMTGFVSSAKLLAEWYGAADAFVFCSSMDNQPLTMLESMACGVPTFGFAVGGAGELVTQGKNGFMVPHADIPQLSALLRQASADGSLPQMGRNARHYAVQHHDLRAVTARHVQLYRSLRTSRRPGEPRAFHDGPTPQNLG